MKALHTIIVDDSPFFRKIIKDICVQLELTDFTEFDNSEALLHYLEHSDFETDILIFLDINLPGKSGIEVLPDILDICPESNVVIASTMKEHQLIQQCLAIGAINYITKDTAPEQIKLVIQKTLALI